MRRTIWTAPARRLSLARVAIFLLTLLVVSSDGPVFQALMWLIAGLFAFAFVGWVLLVIAKGVAPLDESV